MIRTVTAFGAQREEAARYEDELYNAVQGGGEEGLAMGVGLGCVMLSMFSIFGFSLWYGNRLVVRERLLPGNVFIVFFSVFIGASGLGQAFPSFSALQVARAAAPKVFEVIERQSLIDPLCLGNGKILDKFVGHISFRDVSFNYKSRVEAEKASDRAGNVLQNLNLDIPAGHSQALVGTSGSGKSTIARLVERFYDVSGGQLLIRRR